MTRSTTSLAVLAALLAFPGTGIAQTQSVGTAEAPAAAQDDVLDEKGQIVVIATRLKGQVDAAQAPVATYDENEIAALGAGSITDLLAKVGAQTGSGRGRGDGQPVILVNGQRITNFREMRNFPPEAIKRMEVLPEEVLSLIHI